ncbi:MAG: flagellin [Candidatus Latescibacteria bacterium]|nr:flagellin [Candidatus Latescibacterota bacterium]
MQTIGSSTPRLSNKENTLGVEINTTKTVLSRRRDADLSMEQLELTKAQILQQPGLS